MCSFIFVFVVFFLTYFIFVTQFFWIIMLCNMRFFFYYYNYNCFFALLYRGLFVFVFFFCFFNLFTNQSLVLVGERVAENVLIMLFGSGGLLS